MLAPIKMPPGIYRNGTALQSAGRWTDANLVRFYEDTIRPVGGWRRRSDTPVTGTPRELVTWRDNDNQAWAGIGTEAGLFTMTISGAIADITPAGFVAGSPDASFGGGYGSGDYGNGAYGLPITSIDDVIPATVWSLDTWGENLVGCMGPNGTIYEWAPGTAEALSIANAPSARAILVTDERIILALGADGDPRLVKWCDQEDNTAWTATATNQAGDQRLSTKGELLCGVKVPGGALLFTETDCWRVRYLGKPFVYGFDMEGDGNGAVSQNAVVAIDGNVVWMGQEGFWSYQGYVQPVPCEVADHVFAGINRAQLSKVSAFHNSAFGEVWWFYPDETSTENNRYVAYSYREGHWTIGALDRTGGDDRAPFPNPLLCAPDGHIYEHEVGFTHHGRSAFLEGGPLELAGGRIGHVLKAMPDQSTFGDVSMSLTARYETMGEAYSYGPYPAEAWTDMRLSGRQISVRFEGAPDTSWRVGVPKLDLKPGGRR